MITQRKAAANIRKVLRQATEEELAAGHDWYRAANERALIMALDFGISIEAVAYIIAALSPGVRWEQNVAAARKLIATALDDAGYISTLVLTGYPKNVVKAKNIAREVVLGYVPTVWKRHLKGKKVVEFAENIILPERCQQVTIDTHAISIALGKRFTTKSAPKLRITEFTRISAAYIQVAAEHNISPNQCQAITWLVWRRLHKGRKR